MGDSTSRDIFLAVDRQGRVDSWTREAGDSIPCDRDGEPDRDDVDLLATDDRKTFATAVDRARETGDAGPFELTVSTADGPVVHEMTACRVDTADGDLVAVALVARDPADTLRPQESHSRTEQLDAFASILAHDLRSPLSIVQTRLELARETGDLSHLDPAEEAVRRINRMVDDVLTLTRDGIQPENVREVPLGEIAHEAWTVVGGEGPSLTTGTLPTVTGDRDLLQRLFENLFRNALEHGGDDVQVTVGPLGLEEFYVADTGPGIPQAARDRVFEEGYANGNGGGTGLGLAIVRHVANAHGWTAQVTDSEDGGACFEFRHE